MSQDANRKWILDTSDKFQKFGVMFVSCKDATTKEIIFYQPLVGFNFPGKIAKLFVDAIERKGVAPTILQTDNWQGFDMVRECQAFFQGAAVQTFGMPRSAFPGWHRLLINVLGSLMRILEDGGEYRGSWADRMAFIAVYLPLMKSLIGDMAAIDEIRRLQNGEGVIPVDVGLQIPLNGTFVCAESMGISGQMPADLPNDVSIYFEIWINNAGAIITYENAHEIFFQFRDDLEQATAANIVDVEEE